MTRNEAVQLGLKIYNNGTVCKNGHSEGRYTSTGNCVICNKIAAAENMKKHRSKIQAQKFGMVDLYLRVRKEDEQTIRGFVLALEIDRPIDMTSPFGVTRK